MELFLRICQVFVLNAKPKLINIINFNWEWLTILSQPRITVLVLELFVNWKIVETQIFYKIIIRRCHAL